AMIWTMMSHRTAPAPTFEAEAPILDQGEVADKPKPVPNASKIRDIAAATNAPAITAPHETPEAYASFLMAAWGKDRRSVIKGAATECAMKTSFRQVARYR